MAKSVDVGVLAELEAELNGLQRQVADKIIVGLVLATPKKTGLATGNWQASINKPITTTTPRTDLTGANVATEEKRVIEQAKNYKFPVIYITNNVDYILYLNDGTSDQAPAKFVERAVLNAERARLI